MLKLSESDIEDIIHSSPWLLDERYLLPNILGSRGKKGRQINIGRDSSRFVDLVFKDTRDNRPVLVELKKGRLTRENIAQILEYRALLLTMDEDLKENWKAEFEENYYIPKLMLIGSEADEATVLSANLAGIELRLFGNNTTLNLGFESLQKVKAAIAEWNSIRSSGNRTLLDRVEWIESIIDQVKEVVSEFKEASTIPAIPELRGNRKSYIPYYFPYLNIPIYYKEYTLIGIYEYYDETFHFDAEYFYLDFNFILDYEADDKLSKKAFKEVIAIADQIEEIELLIPEGEEAPSLRIKRTVLEQEKRFKQILKILIKKGMKIFDDTFEDK